MSTNTVPSPVFYCAIVTLSFRRALFTIFDIKKCSDLEIGVRVHSMSLKVATFDSMVSYQCFLVTLSLKCTVFEIFNFKNAVTLKTRSGSVKVI